MFYLLLLLLFVSSYLNCMEELSPIETTKKQIMSGEFLKNHEIAREKVCKKIEALGFNTEKKYAERIKILEESKKKYPLIALSECSSTQEDVPCPLSRKVNPSYRETYENIVSKELARQADIHQKLSIASFGCGELLSDVIIYNKALAVSTPKELTIHQIDHQLIIPQLYLNKTEENRRVKKHSFSSEEALNSIQEVLQSNKGVFDENSEENALVNDSGALKNTILSELHTYSLIHGSLLEYLEQAFPKTIISIYIHATAQHYLQEIQNKKFPKPSVVIASDIDDGYGMEKNSVGDYYSLRSKALENDNAAAYILARSPEKPSTQAQIRCMKMENGQLIEASMKTLS